MPFTSRWLTYRPSKSTGTPKKATDRTDKSPSAPPSVGSVSPQVARSQKEVNGSTPLDQTPSKLETGSDPTDRTDRRAFVSFVGSLLARYQENGRPEALTAAAAELLSHYQRQAPTQHQWLEHFDDALKAIRATFPPDRREHALRFFKSSYIDGRSADLIAANTVALQLWAADERRRFFGHYLEAAFAAAGLDLDDDMPPGASL